jgi:hypothetical protein
VAVVVGLDHHHTATDLSASDALRTSRYPFGQQKAAWEAARTDAAERFHASPKLGKLPFYH